MQKTLVGLLLALLAAGNDAVAQDAVARENNAAPPVEIVRVEPHSHLLCQLQSDDPWHSCLLIEYRNVSAQPITAIRFGVSFISAMMESEPSVYSYDDSRKVKPGKRQVALWGDGVYWQKYGDKMSASVSVVKVMFADGTFWTPPPAPTTPGALDIAIAARKQFAKAILDSVKNPVPGFNITAEGPDANLYVLHLPGMTYAKCQSVFTDETLSELKRAGFTLYVCTDDAKTTFTIRIPR